MENSMLLIMTARAAMANPNWPTRSTRLPAVPGVPGNLFIVLDQASNSSKVPKSVGVDLQAMLESGGMDLANSDTNGLWAIVGQLSGRLIRCGRSIDGSEARQEKGPKKRAFCRAKVWAADVELMQDTTSELRHRMMMTVMMMTMRTHNFLCKFSIGSLAKSSFSPSQ